MQPRTRRRRNLRAYARAARVSATGTGGPKLTVWKQAAVVLFQQVWKFLRGARVRRGRRSRGSVPREPARRAGLGDAGRVRRAAAPTCPRCLPRRVQPSPLGLSRVGRPNGPPAHPDAKAPARPPARPLTRAGRAPSAPPPPGAAWSGTYGGVDVRLVYAPVCHGLLRLRLHRRLGSILRHHLGGGWRFLSSRLGATRRHGEKPAGERHGRDCWHGAGGGTGSCGFCCCRWAKPFPKPKKRGERLHRTSAYEKPRTSAYENHLYNPFEKPHMDGGAQAKPSCFFSPSLFGKASVLQCLLNRRVQCVRAAVICANRAPRRECFSNVVKNLP